MMHSLRRHDFAKGCKILMQRGCQEPNHGLLWKSSRSPFPHDRFGTIQRRCLGSNTTKRPHTTTRLNRAQRMQNQESLGFGGMLVTTVAVLSGAISAVVMAKCEKATNQQFDEHLKSNGRSSEKEEILQPLRKESFRLSASNHQTAVRIVKVCSKITDDNNMMSHSPLIEHQQSPHQYTMRDYTVRLTLYSKDAHDSFFTGDNSKVITACTQRRLIQTIAEEYSFESPEEFGMILAQCILLQYPWLDSMDVHVDEHLWERVRVDGQGHPHGFVKCSGARYHATVHLERGQGPLVSSSMTNIGLCKTAQSGFEGFYRNELTKLPDTNNRCMCAQLEATWTYVPTSVHQVDYCALRKNVQKILYKAYFGSPATNGIYSPSLQATLYDTACLVLAEEPHLQSLTLQAAELPLMNDSMEPNSSYLLTENETLRVFLVEGNSDYRQGMSCTVDRGCSIPAKRPSLLRGSDVPKSNAVEGRPVRLQPQRSKLPKD